MLNAQGKSMAEAIRSIGVTEVTYYRWRSEYGGLKGDQVKRLKVLGAENAWLRCAVSDLTFELDGPDIMIPAPAVHSLGLVLHELAANAAVHGALAQSNGRHSVNGNLKVRVLSSILLNSAVAGRQRR